VSDWSAANTSSQVSFSGLRVSALRKLIALEAEGLFTQREVRRYAGPWAPAGTRWKKTPLRQAERYRALTIRAALPYYLLILIQTVR